MKVSLRWLEEFIDLPHMEPAELADILAMLGHEVEGYEVLTPDWAGVIVGRVEEIAAHPSADKVRVCQVDLGSGRSQIICGAWNFDAGAYVPVAVPGAVLPGDFHIGTREIRGVASNGMICSERELGLGDDHAGILVLDGEHELGTDFSALVELPDVVYDLSITPDRPDALSLVGVARDLSAKLEVPFRIPERPLSTTPGATDITVDIEDPSGCRRFNAREIKGVRIGRSPMWLRHRLTKAGVRSISNVVDVTNYVMIELGHPLHAFDADKIEGRALSIRRASPGETLETLDGDTRGLDADDLIIYDRAGPTSMSGTMGGARSEVSDKTVDVLMEAASWDPPTILYMAKRHALRSEASIRFERGVDPNLSDVANQRASAMVADLAGGVVLEGFIDEGVTQTARHEVLLPISEVERLLGEGFESAYVSGILARLGMEVDGDDPLRVMVPTNRPDVTRPADLIEEIARIHGFEKFEPTLPLGVAGSLSTEQKRERRLMEAMAGAGLSQAVTLPFVGEADLVALDRGDEIRSLLRVKNPLRDEEGRLRPSVLPNLLNAVKYNVSHGIDSVALFEVGAVFQAVAGLIDPRLPRQPRRLAWAVVGGFGPRILDSQPAEGGAELSFAVLRNLLGVMGIDHYELRRAQGPGMHPGRTAEVLLAGATIGLVGELAPLAADHFELPNRVAVAELDLAPLIDPAGLHEAWAPSVFPFVDFDLSFVVPDELPVAELVATTESAGAGLVEAARVFDEFKGKGVGEGRRAVAIHYRLRASDHTLTNEEVAPVRRSMIAAADGLGARLRGAG